MKVYLAGPMRGYPQFNFPAFHAAAAHLRAQGHEVFNPAERDEAEHGKDVSNSATGSLADVAHTGFDHRAAMKADTAWICDHADAVFVLPGWQNSKGATAEVALAECLGLPVVEHFR
jgi:hypothetical protein